MKSTATLVLAAALAASFAFAQHANPRGTAEATVGGADISIEYGRPSLQGRDMLGMAGEGTVWRLGADTSTTLTTSADLDFSGVSVAAGSYSLFAEKTADGWTLLVNSQTGQWGTERDAANDVAEIPMTLGSGPSAEMFTATVSGDGSGGELHFQWGETTMSASFTVE